MLDAATPHAITATWELSCAATSSAVTPDAVQAGTWDVTLPWQPNSEVRSVSPDTALGLLMA